MSGLAARSPPPAARRPLPTLYFLLPSLPPPLHLQHPVARTAQFRPTAWHPSASAVCLGLGESNQERRLQFSGRAVRGASSLLFIHQQRGADLGLALGCRRPRPLSALGSTLHRCRSSCAAPTRGSAASSLARAPLFPSLYPCPSRAPGSCAPGRSRLRGCLAAPLLAGCSGSQLPGTPACQLLVSFPLPVALICAQAYLRVIWAQRGGSRSPTGKQTSFLLSSPGLCVRIHFSVVISNEPKRFGKAAPRRPARLCFPLSLKPSEPPCHSSCSLLWGGFGSRAVSRPPPFLCTPLHPVRPIPERSGLSTAGDDRGVGWGGRAGESARAGSRNASRG